MSQTSEPKSNSSDSLKPGWEKDTIEKILLASISEQRSARRWGIFFKLVFLVLIGLGALQSSGSFPGRMSKDGGSPHTAVIDVAGMIAPGQPASSDNIIQGLRDAVDDHDTKGIILRMNTPGGSPVQSAYVWEEVRRLKKLHPQLPIIAVVADMCASGGYYIASAADKIYVAPASVVGSIGVIMGGFGFVDTMKLLGVERRVMTSGDHKALMDPFSPVDPVAKAHLQGLMGEIHQQFISAVKQGRGDRIKETSDMFSGLIWTGVDAVKLGLADDFGDDRHVAEDIIGAKKLVNFNPEDNLFDRLSRSFGTSVGEALAESTLFKSTFH